MNDKTELESIVSWLNSHYSQDSDDYSIFNGAKPGVVRYNDNIAISLWGCGAVVCIVDQLYFIGEDDGYVLDENFCAKSYRRYMDLRLIECYESSPMLGFQMLLMNGLMGTIRSQRRASSELEAYLASITPQLRKKSD